MAGRVETVGVRPMGDSIEVRIKYQGKTIRPRLRLQPTKANLLHAHRVREQAVQAIRQGTFNLLTHFPDYRLTDRVEKPAAGRTFGEWCKVWSELAERDLERSTLLVYRRHLEAYWQSSFGEEHPSKITKERIRTHLSTLAANGLGRKTQNNIIIPLRAVFDLICSEPGAGPNPLSTLRNLKVQSGEPDPFSPEELETALAEVRSREGQVMADYFEFAAFSGLRSSEQIALTWGEVDLPRRFLRVRKAKVLGHLKNRTKTSYSRLVELNDRALAVLNRQLALTGGADHEVFWSPRTGLPWADEQTQRKIWKRVLARCKVRHRPPKELRDTSVTLALMAGADPWYVAQQHGHSLTVMQRDYARWMPQADGGRNLAKVNLGVSSGVS